jgi:4-amino-4-deoxy-L-arabinose transferase-like glycosyltransferase
MTSLSQTRERSGALVPGLGLAIALIAILTFIRLAGLTFSTVDLFFDEAQYWAWSREPAFGYFSKPPLLAWTIALAERICGSSEACIRAPAPILYFGTSLLVYAVARQLYESKTAFYAALSIALATGTAFSARIISTDVPLLFFWALALLAYVKLINGGDMRWGAVLGVALGLGLMAK